MEGINDGEPSPEEIDNQIESFKKQEEDLAQQMDNFEAPAGMGNSSEMAEKDSPEVQNLRSQFQENQEELDEAKNRLESLTEDSIHDYLEPRQSPQDDVSGVTEAWARSHGTESEMFPDDVREESEELRGRIEQLQNEQDSLAQEIQEARRRQYGYPKTD